MSASGAGRPARGLTLFQADHPGDGVGSLRIDRSSIDDDLVMEMRPGGEARLADEADDVTDAQHAARLEAWRGGAEVPVEGLDTAAVADAHVEAGRGGRCDPARRCGRPARRRPECRRARRSRPLMEGAHSAAVLAFAVGAPAIAAPALPKLGSLAASGMTGLFSLPKATATSAGMLPLLPGSSAPSGQTPG